MRARGPCASFVLAGTIGCGLVALVALLPKPAVADDGPSIRERSWAEGLARAVGLARGEARAVTADGATGVGVDLEGLTARRFRFPDAASALAFARGGLGRSRSQALIEVRGAQVLLLRGPVLDDSARAAKAREAGWLILRAPQDEPDLLAVCKDGQVAASGPAAQGSSIELAPPSLVSYLGRIGRAAPRRRPVAYPMKVAPGQSEDRALPALDDGSFWYVILAGPDGGDVDLRLASAEHSWASAGPTPFEDLLVPGDRPLKATVRNSGTTAGESRLICCPVAPADAVGMKTLAAALDAQDVPVQLHAVEPCEDWTLLRFGCQRSKVEVVAYDAALREVALAEPDPDGLQSLVLPPGDRIRWLCVRGGDPASGDGAYAVERGRIRITGELGPEGTRGELQSADAWYRMRVQPGIVLVRLAPAGRVGRSGATAANDLDLIVHGQDGSKRQATSPDATEDVAINARADAEYLVRVRVGRGGGGGPFTLATEALDIDRLAADGADGPHTWALMVGVAAYQRVSNTVNFTRGDALAMYDVLRTAGTIEPERSIVLIDERARAETVRRALAAIVRRADADDTILIFFAGHGTNDLPDAEPRDERDGHDEALVCFDKNGYVTDDDLRALLEPARAAQVAIIVNACHSGGLAEVIDRPGRFGLFSSLETQLSAETSVLEAGILTAAVLDGLRGEADRDHDGVVGLRELGRYAEARVVTSCMNCGGRIGPRDATCGRCGHALTGPNDRQTPVLCDQLRAELPLARVASR